MGWLVGLVFFGYTVPKSNYFEPVEHSSYKKLFLCCLDDKKPVSVFLNKFKWSQLFFSQPQFFILGS